MSSSTQHPLVTGAVLAGAGVAGYFTARWLLDVVAPPPDTTAPSTTATPAPIMPLPARPVPALTSPAQPRPPDRHDADGPVTSPAQVDSAAGPSSARVPRTFDPIFARHAGDLPIPFLRALAMHESGLDPNARGRAGWGLFQITEVVRVDFNRTHRTAITRAQLLDPDINTRIAAWLLARIVAGYARNHPTIPNLQPDWRNPRATELAVFGWNAGFSEAGGVGRVVRYLEAKGARDIDLALVHAHAATAGASRHLSNPAKVRWSRGVVALYLRELAGSSSVA